MKATESFYPGQTADTGWLCPLAHNRIPEELLVFPVAGEFSLSAASAFLPVSLGPFLMSPREPSASVQKLHSCKEKKLMAKQHSDRTETCCLTTITELPMYKNAMLQDIYLSFLCTNHVQQHCPQEIPQEWREQWWGW